MGVRGSGDTEVYVTYSTKDVGEGVGLGIGTERMTTTTTTTETQYGVGVGGERLLMGVGEEGDTGVDVTCSTKVDEVALGTGQLTTTITTTETQ